MKFGIDKLSWVKEVKVIPDRHRRGKETEIEGERQRQRERESGRTEDGMEWGTKSEESLMFELIWKVYLFHIMICASDDRNTIGKGIIYNCGYITLDSSDRDGNHRTKRSTIFPYKLSSPMTS